MINLFALRGYRNVGPEHQTSSPALFGINAYCIMMMSNTLMNQFCNIRPIGYRLSHGGRFRVVIAGDGKQHQAEEQRRYCREGRFIGYIDRGWRERRVLDFVPAAHKRRCILPRETGKRAVDHVNNGRYRCHHGFKAELAFTTEEGSRLVFSAVGEENDEDKLRGAYISLSEVVEESDVVIGEDAKVVQDKDEMSILEGHVLIFLGTYSMLHSLKAFIQVRIDSEAPPTRLHAPEVITRSAWFVIASHFVMKSKFYKKGQSV
ncbi:hypothetical protein ARMGADRAFT_1036517 [Armillaria gallica]|uniref:Uncharacterized protein n=1 Tax=Armillaria gallica TaxID=47427 RepID=A0A2H3CUV2_ARMGA|nr:hypothetical protein ARMGADRAFT_1036517 [Armillaria gallica]